MEKNCIVVAVYKNAKGKVYRNYYLIYNGIYTPIKIDSDKEFITNNIKNCPVYPYEQFRKVIVGELLLKDLQTTTYKEYCSVYVGA